ncbi:MAG: phage terminase large subunit family protein, partial [Actinobacteria bacterium]|nr:phage terminase large subunit family protein [Actinomycetota bacterium]
ETDQRYWVLKCPGCGRWHCLEDEFAEHHGSPGDPRQEICFIRGEPGREALVCLDCGHKLDPGAGRWVAKYPGRPTRGYQLSKFQSQVLSQKEREQGHLTKPAALLAEWRATRYPEEFFNSEVGLPYLAAEGGLSEQDLLALEGPYGQPESGRGCVMGVDQGHGLHLVVKEPTESEIVLTVRVHHEPMTDAVFSHLDHFMAAYDVRACVIDALPNTHAARAFARRFPGRVWLSFYSATQRGGASFSRDQEGTPIVTVNRTESLDAWRDAHKLARRRLPRETDELREYRRQLTNILRKVEEDPVSGEKRARWIKRGPDHFAHADNYAEIALGRRAGGRVSVEVVG